MLKITDDLADKVFDVPIDGLTRKYQIVPQFSSTLRRDIVFWEKLKQNSIEGELLELKLLSILFLDQLRQRLIAEREQHQDEIAQLQARIRELERYKEVQGRRLASNRCRKASSKNSAADEEIDSGDEGIKKVMDLKLKDLDEADDEASSEA